VWHGKHPFTGYPVVQGHEYSAVIEAVGEGIHDLKVGRKVTATPQLVCGECGPCRRGDYHICNTLKVEGFQAPGTAQDLFVTKAEKVVPLPDSFSFEQGALVEPVSVAVHSVNRVASLAGKNVVVLGAGPIGNLVGQVASASGAKVLITDLSDFRLDIAKRCGLQHGINPNSVSLKEGSAKIFGESGFDIAFECVGVDATMKDAIENVQKGGTVVVVGVFGEKARIDLGLVQDRELSLVGTLMYKYEDYLKAVELIDAGDIITEPLFSKHFDFGKFADAYAFIDEQRDKTMKVFIDL
jgi:2-desacetyl-2-hydroxyethyl bacteriochlorophyllide A dehydrogenase